MACLRQQQVRSLACLRSSRHMPHNALCQCINSQRRRHTGDQLLCSHKPPHNHPVTYRPHSHLSPQPYRRSQMYIHNQGNRHPQHSRRPLERHMLSNSQCPDSSTSHTYNPSHNKASPNQSRPTQCRNTKVLQTSTLPTTANLIIETMFAYVY
jgi:hypothetical protein